MKRKSRTKIVKRVNAFLIALVVILSSIQAPVQGAIKQDYGSITLSDIILAWYNASGVAIGNTQIANAIESAYGDITLNDLVDEGVLYSDYIGIEGGDLKEMIGYGNLSAPLIKVNLGRLRDYLPELPTTNVAYNALNAMFTWENSTWFENNLGAIIGTVANIGKIAYSVGTDILNEIVDTNLSFPWQERVTLRDIYRNFTDSTYFQDLLESSTIGGGSSNVSYDGWTLEKVPDNYVDMDWGAVIVQDSNGKARWAWVVFVVPNFNGLLLQQGAYYYINTNNANDYSVSYGVKNYATVDEEGMVISLAEDVTAQTQSARSRSSATSWNAGSSPNYHLIGYVTEQVGTDIDVNNMWNNTSGEGAGITDYINSAVGNITEENYSILSPNINVGEYMYLADGATYIENLNQITNNTDNGDYSQNGDVITNYNNTYIQNTMQETRPTVAPAQSPIPAQPFISPRPTQPPETYEAVIHQGGIPETIKQKFPFCIPWDLAAVLQNLWAPEARAPYIHWDATFGSWGKLGEVDLDFSIFNDAARIFRATTLILWIIGLVVITRNIIGG